MFPPQLVAGAAGAPAGAAGAVQSVSCNQIVSQIPIPEDRKVKHPVMTELTAAQS